jgi:hypothetical protein
MHMYLSMWTHHHIYHRKLSPSLVLLAKVCPCRTPKDLVPCQCILVTSLCILRSGNNKGGSITVPYHCTVDLLFDCFGISCMTTDNFCFYLQNRLIQTSQTGGQWYSDIFPFSIPCLRSIWLVQTLFLILRRRKKGFYNLSTRRYKTEGREY